MDKYPVLLDGKKDSKKFQIFKRMQMKIGATQTEPYLALCRIERLVIKSAIDALTHLVGVLIGEERRRVWRDC